MVKYPGLKFHKFDLHVHSPASQDYETKTNTPKDIVDKAIEKGLKGIVITDHNTGAWIDQIKEAAKNKPLIVFPGVEVYCPGGKTGIHIIGILDVKKGTEHINGLLAALKFSPDDFGKTNAATRLAPYDVISIISSEPYNGATR